MPLRVIRVMLEDDPERIRALIELEDRVVEHALANAEERSAARRVPAKEIRERYDIPQNVLARLGEIGVLSPSSRGYGPDDVQIVEAISRFRAGGYDEALGFTVYDTLRYREALEPLVQEEVRSLLDRLAGEVELERAHQIIAAGAEPLRELIGAYPLQLLLAELARQRSGEASRAATTSRGGAPSRRARSPVGRRPAACRRTCRTARCSRCARPAGSRCAGARPPP